MPNKKEIRYKKLAIKIPQCIWIIKLNIKTTKN